MVVLPSVTAIRIGINVLDLKDTVCNRDMKIVSNPVNGFPLHFKIKNNFDGTLIWEGDSTENLDYSKGGFIIVEVPNDLPWIYGELYDLEMDVDMVQIQRNVVGYSYVYNGVSIGRGASYGTLSPGVNSPWWKTITESCTSFTGSNNYVDSHYASYLRVSNSDRDGHSTFRDLAAFVAPYLTERTVNFNSVWNGNYLNLNSPTVGLIKIQFVYQ